MPGSMCGLCVGAAVVSGRDAPPIFQFAEHALDLVALLVEVFTVGVLCFPALDARVDASFKSVKTSSKTFMKTE